MEKSKKKKKNPLDNKYDLTDVRLCNRVDSDKLHRMTNRIEAVYQINTKR